MEAPEIDTIQNVEGSTMSVTKTFDFSDITSRIVVHGTHEEPLFRLNQIDKVLGKTNLRGTVADFDDDEKCVSESLHCSR